MSAAAPSALLNCLRWGGLGFGVFYGFNHHYTLVQLKAQNQIKAEIKRKEDLIKKAKEAFALHKAAASSSVISDPTHPNFDLEKYVKSLEKRQ